MPQNPYIVDWSGLPDQQSPQPIDWSGLPDQSPVQPKSKEPHWYDPIMEQFTIPNAVRMGLSTIGDLAGAGASALFPPAAPAIYGGISFLGGAAGELGGELLEGKSPNWGLIGTEGVMNLAPGPNIPGKGALLKDVGKYALKTGVYGAGQGLVGSVPRHIAETGEWELPSAGEAAGQTIMGAGMGTLLGGAYGYAHSRGSARGVPAPNGGIPPPDSNAGRVDVLPPENPPPNQGPDVVTIRDPVKEVPYWKSRGYVSVAGMASADKYPQMVRGDIAPMYRDASTRPTIAGGREVPGPISGDYAPMGDVVRIPNQNMNDEVIQNMRIGGYEQGETGDTHTLFHKGGVGMPRNDADLAFMEGPPIDITGRQRANQEMLPGEDRGRVAPFQPPVGQSRPRQVYDVANDLEQTLRHNIQDDPNVERLMREAEDLILRETDPAIIEDHVRQLYDYTKKPNATDDERELFGSLFDLARGNLSEEQRTGRPSAPMDQTWRDLGNLETAFRGELQGTIPEGTGSRMLGQIPNRDAQYADIIRSIRPTDTPIIPPTQSPLRLVPPPQNVPPQGGLDLGGFRQERLAPSSEGLPEGPIVPDESRDISNMARPKRSYQDLTPETYKRYSVFDENDNLIHKTYDSQEAQRYADDYNGYVHDSGEIDPTRGISEMAHRPVDQLYGNREFQIELEKVSRMSNKTAAQAVYRIDTMLNTMREQGHNRPTAVRQLEQIRAAADLRARGETPSTWGQPRTHEEIDQEIFDQQKADRRDPSYARASEPEETNIRMKVGRVEDLLRNQQGTYAEHGGRVANKELLQNAIDATDTGGTVYVKLNYANRTISVTDNGPGLPIDMIENEYITLTGSGKRGVGAASGRRSIGEMGVGKATYLLGVDKFEVHTIAKEPDGSTWKYEFEGNADSMIGEDMQGNPVPPVNVRKTRMPDGTPTGTEVTIHDGDVDNLKAAHDYLDTFAAYSDTAVNVNLKSDRKPGGYSWDQLNTTVNPRVTTVGQHVASGSGPGGDYQIFVPQGANWDDRQYATAIITSRGMFQGADSINLGGKGKLPDRIVVNIEPTVSAQQAKLYPLTSPTREKMKDPFKNVIEAEIKTNLTDAAEKARTDDIKAAYASLQPDINTRNNHPLPFVLHDAGDRYTPDERARVANSPRIQAATSVMKQILSRLDALFPNEQIGGKTDKYGLLINDPSAGGINIPNLLDRTKNAILINLFGALHKATSPKEAAARLVHVVAHEFNHNIIRNEGGQFTWSLANVLSRLTLEEQVVYKNAFFKSLTDSSGGYAPEVQSLLQEYLAARGRPDTTVDLITRSAEGRFIAESGQSGIESRSGSNGEGTTVGNIQGPPTPPPTKTGGSGGGDEPPRRGNFFRDTLGWGQGASKGGKHKKEDVNWVEEALALPSAVTTTGDLSYPGRQGLALVLTKEFWQAAGKMFKGGLSPEAFKAMNDDLYKKELMTPRINTKTGEAAPSIGEELGFRIHDLASNTPMSKRAHGIVSRWLETGGNIPGVSALYRNTIGVGVRAANRAYLTMANQLTINRGEFLMNKARDMSILALETGKARPGLLKQSFNKDEAMDLNPYHNLVLGKEIADFVNTATGHAPLKTHLLPAKQAEISLESSAKALSNVLFSPGLLFRGIRMMNPSTYIMASPYVRKQYLKATLSAAAAWYGFTELAKLAGGDDVNVNNDPSSADFGKIRIGDTRLDPGGGFQQFLVAYGRMYKGGSTSSSTGQFHRFGEGYQAQTQEDMMQRFVVNKLNPVTKFAYDIASASQYNPFHVYDRSVQMFIPLFAQDLYEIGKEDPSLLPAMGTGALFGMGTQNYSKGESVGKIIPPENDILYSGGRGLGDLMPWNWNQ